MFFIFENYTLGLTPHLGQPVETESLARYRDANLLVLRALADDRAYGQNWTRTRVTAALIEARDNVKYNPDAVDCLIRSGLVHLYEYDKHLASAVDSSNQVCAYVNTGGGWGTVPSPSPTMVPPQQKN